MLTISSLWYSTKNYGDAATLAIHISDDHNLFEGDKLFEETPFEDLYDQVYILRGYSGEPVAHMPVSQIQVPWRELLLTGVEGQQQMSTVRRTGN